MDGKGASRGQPEAANHWRFNRHLNAVNLAPSNGDACLLVGYIYSSRHGKSHKRLWGILR